MDTSNTINLLLLVVTAIAAAFALWQAITASRSRRDAQQANVEAAEHERSALRAAQESAASSTRSADAAERQAAAAERALHGQDPFVFERLGQTRWKVTNRTGGPAFFRVVEGQPGLIQVEEENLNGRQNGGSFHINFGGGLTDPASTDVMIGWQTQEGDLKYFTHTIP